MRRPIPTHVTDTLRDIRAQGLYKQEREIRSPQRPRLEVADGRPVLNLCANNYLGLATHPEVMAAAHQAIDAWGYGLASVRFICGTQSIHRQLEQTLSEFLGTEETILYSSCFDANGGLFETLLGPEDAVISDELNHASIIDGVRLCKAQRFRFKNKDLSDLQVQLESARQAGARQILITTDGVFSMDGLIADLAGVCELADRYQALVHFDDCHATGFVGPTGRGTHEYHGVIDRIDVTTGTLGKALGGASGGYTSGRRELIELLRQRSRPYLFSNSLAPPMVGGALQALEIVKSSTQLRDRLEVNTRHFRDQMLASGYQIVAGEHPIVPIMLGDAPLAAAVAERLLELGVYVISFSFPVVPLGKARIRVQMSAAHTSEDLDFALEQFRRVRKELL